MKTQHPNAHQYFKDILNILSPRISGDFMDTKDRHHIEFISFNVKCQNVSTHAHFPTGVKWAFSESTFAGLARLQYKRKRIIGYLVRIVRCSYFDFLNNIVLS